MPCIVGIKFFENRLVLEYPVEYSNCTRYIFTSILYDRTVTMLVKFSNRASINLNVSKQYST